MDKYTAAKLLNVNIDGSPEDFKKAYRKQALINHPDKGGDPEVFKEMKQAYETLTSKEDNPWEGLEEMFSREGMEKMFSHMFSRRETPKKLKATHLDMALTLAELYKGGVFEISFQREHKGKTRFTKVQQQIMGGFVIEQIVPIESESHREDVTLAVTILPGTMEGDVVTARKEGDTKPDFEPGDVIVHIHQLKHPNFKRINYDLEVKVNITLTEALTGVSQTIFHLDGTPILLDFDEVVKPGHCRLYKGMGMPQGNDTFGDLRIRWKIKFPNSLSDEQKQIIKDTL